MIHLVPINSHLSIDDIIIQFIVRVGVYSLVFSNCVPDFVLLLFVLIDGFSPDRHIKFALKTLKSTQSPQTATDSIVKLFALVQGTPKDRRKLIQSDVFSSIMRLTDRFCDHEEFHQASVMLITSAFLADCESFTEFFSLAQQLLTFLRTTMSRFQSNRRIQEMGASFIDTTEKIKNFVSSVGELENFHRPGSQEFVAALEKKIASTFCVKTDVFLSL